MENKFSTIKSRVVQFAEYKRVNKEKFFEKIGTTSANFRGKPLATPLNSETIVNIITEFPEINLEWLLTGRGSMLKAGVPEKAPAGRLPKPVVAGGLINFYDVDFAAGGDIAFYEDNNAVTPSYTMDIPEFGGCTAFRTYGDSMSPLVRSGSILFGTIVANWQSHLEYGQIYGIVCLDQRKYLKYIRKDPQNPQTHFLLRSENPEYDDFELPKEAIKSVWLIHGWINKRT